MSTAPVTPAPVQSELATLAHKHVTVTYALIATLVVVMGLVAFGGWLGLKGYEAQLAKAQATEQVYIQDRAQWQAQVVKDDAQRQAQALQIAQLQAQIAHRDAQPLPKAVQAGLAPNADANTVATAVSVAYSNVPSFGQATSTPGGQIALSVPQAQAVVVSKESGDKAVSDLADERTIVGLQTGTIGTLTSDLNGCKSTLSEAQKTIDGYKKAAVKSKWRKFLDGAEKAGLFIGGVAIGRKI